MRIQVQTALPSVLVIVDRICNETRRNFLKFPLKTINPLSGEPVFFLAILLCPSSLISKEEARTALVRERGEKVMQIVQPNGPYSA